MGKKEERLLICLLIVMSVSAITWCLMDNSTCKQKDEYTYFNDFTGNSPNYKSSPRSYKSFNASEPGDTAFPFGERCPNSVVGILLL